MNSQTTGSRLRVAHIFRDQSRNIHCREGWLEVNKPETLQGSQFKDKVRIVYVDDGQEALIPATEIKILGKCNNGQLRVGHLGKDANGFPSFKQGILSLSNDKLSTVGYVIYDGETDPVKVDLTDLVVLGNC